MSEEREKIVLSEEQNLHFISVESKIVRENIDQLAALLEVEVVDEEKTVFNSEIKYMSAFNYEERETIKKKIFELIELI